MQQVLQQVKNDPQMVQRVMQSPDGQKLMQLLAKEKGKYLFTAGANPYLTIKPARGEGEKPLELIKKCFEALKD